MIDLKKYFKAYYTFNFSSNIKEIEKREFAIVYWNNEWMKRHISIPNEFYLKHIFENHYLKHFYQSVARYKKPSVEDMNDKMRINSDFVIDIDSDHIDLPCLKIHDKKYVCSECLNRTKIETRKSLDFIVEDFGISKDNINLSFSGKRGFHISIDEEKMIKLDSECRRELVDYFVGNNFDRDIHKIFIPTQGAVYIGKMRKGLWGLKIIQRFLHHLRNDTLFDLVIHHDYNLAQLLEEHKSYITSKIFDEEEYLAVKGIDSNGWDLLFKILKDDAACHIDVPVSIDLVRLIRVENSIHGGSGLVAKSLKIEDLESFHPFKNAIPFPNSKELIDIPIKTKTPFYQKPHKFHDKINHKKKCELNLALHLYCTGRYKT